MNKQSILIIEDDEPLRYLYKTVFEEANFDVHEAVDGITGVDAALLKKPQAIILDLMLPKQGGLAVLKIIRSHPDLLHLPVVVLTALDNPAYKEEARPNVQGYFLKIEVQPKDIVNHIKKILSN